MAVCTGFDSSFGLSRRQFLGRFGYGLGSSLSLDVRGPFLASGFLLGCTSLLRRRELFSFSRAVRLLSLIFLIPSQHLTSGMARIYRPR